MSRKEPTAIEPDESLNVEKIIGMFTPRTQHVVQLAVQEGALRELARFGQARADPGVEVAVLVEVGMSDGTRTEVGGADGLEGMAVIQKVRVD